MIKLDELFKIINSEGISLEDMSIKDTKGIYIKLPNIPPVIGLNQSAIDTTNTYLSVLSEELGHHFTSYGDLTKVSTNYIDIILKDKTELKAKLWAANFLINDAEFVQAILSCISTKYDLSKEFDVTEEIIDYKILSICLDESKFNNIRKIIFQNEVPYFECKI